MNDKNQSFGNAIFLLVNITIGGNLLMYFGIKVSK